MLHPGLYDQPVDLALSKALEALDPALAELRDLDPAAAPEILARVVQERLRRALQGIGGAPHERRQAQIQLVNAVMGQLRELAPREVVDDDAIASPGRRLLAVSTASRSGLTAPAAPVRPRIPLASSELLVNGPHDLSLGSEILRELASADRVDLLCSFLKWSGFRLIEPALKALLDRRPGGLRVLTTAYMGATDRRALDELSRLGADVRVSYDTDRTRLHAKAWLFHRNTGFSTGYVGSSNLSTAAMLDGLEWNVRLSRTDNRGILDKFEACFEQYWADPEFHPYDPARDAQRYDDAVRRQVTDRTRLILAFDVEPRAHQREILEALDAERAAGHDRNLVVAATGTGKTVVAAFDYRRIKERLGRASLLFVAHRREILEQSMTTFQVVLKDGAFGELLVAGERPRSDEHVFASVQSLTTSRLAELPADAFDVVIVDEFHHAAAPTYERLLEHLRPKYLLGLTATPERTDGVSILHWFDDRVAADLRLWKALDQGLLAPFQYFGVAGPDLSGVKWSRGRYEVADLSNVYTGDDFFIRRVLQELHAKVVDLHEMRALGFCVDVAHAELMARRFQQAGIEARAVTGTTPKAERRGALDGLQRGEVQIIFSVDVFNEGVDLPNVDTIVFLRPTESATLFLQQLGRGLRHARGKSCCTVLDFIGGAHRKFRFDQRFRAILGGTRQSIRRQVEDDFPRLPSGCAIRLDRVAAKAVIDNIRDSIGSGRTALVEDLRALGDVPLPRFLAETGLDLEDVYARAGHSFTDLRRRAGHCDGEPTDAQLTMERGLSRMLHLDDPVRLGGIEALLRRAHPPAADPSDPIQRALFILLGQAREPYTRLAETWSQVWAAPDLRGELQDMLRLLADRRRNLARPLAGPLADVPLQIHAHYMLDEVMGAFDARTKKGGVKRIQTGVFEVKERATDLFFVTLEKQERDYSPTTLYQDYPIHERRFHWETQSSCHEGTPTGRRYLSIRPGGDRHALMFVRSRRKDERGLTAPYQLLGPVWYAQHEGARPMQMHWTLEHPIPAATYQQIKVAAG